MKESQIQYRVSQEVKWEKLLALSLELFCTVDTDGICHYTSPASLDLLGYEAWELTNHALSDLLPPAEVPRMEHAFQMVRFGVSRGFRTTLTHKDGFEVVVSWAVTWSEEDGLYYCVGRNVCGPDSKWQTKPEDTQESRQTDRPFAATHWLGHSLEQPAATGTEWEKVELSLSPQTVEAPAPFDNISWLANKASNSVLVTDRQGQVEWANQGFLRLFGYGAEEVLGRHSQTLVPCLEAAPEALAEVEEKLLRGEPVAYELQSRKKGGEAIWVSVEVFPILVQNGVVTRYAEMHTDLTAQKRTEQELSQLTKDLFKKNRDLQQFTYMVSHNLRTPVANAMGLASLLTTIDKNSEAFARSLSYLRLSLYRMDTVLRDMNTILSIRDRRGAVVLERVDPEAVVLQAMSALEEQLREAGATINVDLPDGLTLHTNQAALYSILFNLLANSVKYRAQDRRLEVNLTFYRDPAAGTVITFADNGSGFDMEKNKDNVFKLYKRFHTQTDGRGMGLFLIKTHLDSLGGHVEVSSQPGQGTTFLLTLP
ncbi:PAS domain S-box protein [Rufibacter psychrotolerans]|uniref:PAS domain S-box protein n=1 Tax=Rufibacter psychrotolerans TaxID=2812556 RepID=UPI0019686EF6|nr:PAS domain S-box protein [Rufibacter sp. SYSU D00308]